MHGAVLGLNVTMVLRNDFLLHHARRVAPKATHKKPETVPEGQSTWMHTHNSGCDWGTI